MPRSATPQRSSPARRARPATPSRATRAAAASPKRAVKTTKAAPKQVVRKAAKKTAETSGKKVLGTVARRTAKTGARAIRTAAERAGELGKTALETGTSRRVPIQLSIDVAVPLDVAWGEWLSWGQLPEGIHRVEHVERDGDSLLGRVAGPGGADWEAEILDEREHESFAWRSVEGSDVAGLATFHRLSDRLTRIELDLDVVPTNTSEALTYALHLAHRWAENDLRRFKAHVEFINPDVYEKRNGRSNGRGKRPARNKKRED